MLGALPSDYFDDLLVQGQLARAGVCHHLNFIIGEQGMLIYLLMVDRFFQDTSIDKSNLFGTQIVTDK